MVRLRTAEAARAGLPNAAPAEAFMTTYPDLKLYIGGAWRKTGGGAAGAQSGR